MKSVKCNSCGQDITVDDEDFDRVCIFNWHCSDGKVRMTIVGPPQIEVSISHYITNKPTSILIDHKDLNGHNNTRGNLREGDKKGNAGNTGLRIDNSTGFKGVGWDKARNKWKAYITIGGKVCMLGRFNSKEEAALAYNEAAANHFGEFARLNNVLKGGVN